MQNLSLNFVELFLFLSLNFSVCETSIDFIAPIFAPASNLETLLLQSTISQFVVFCAYLSG